MFIIQYIYTKFPRIKQRHDGTQRMWRSLPTDAEKEELYQKAAIDRVGPTSFTIFKNTPLNIHIFF